LILPYNVGGETLEEATSPDRLERQAVVARTEALGQT
jgi:hypothetical protein